MAHSYTPGLKVTSLATIRRERKLPLPGDVVVTVGQRVPAETIVARTQLPGNVQTVNAANLLGVLPEDVEECLTKPVGSKVEKGETFAESRSFFGLFRSKCHAPVQGTVESVSKVTGQVLLREEPMEVKAIEAGSRGKILVGGTYVTTAVLRKAIAQGVKAVVVGGFDDYDLRQLLGYDLGVAITGSEELGITLIVTEGFGSIPMAARTFDLLRSCEGRRVSVSGATQIRAGVQRPEIVAPLLEATTERDGHVDSVEGGLKPGDMVRVIRQPYFGKIGRVTALPPELMPLETEAKV